jgi:hypothetical protein
MSWALWNVGNEISSNLSRYAPPRPKARREDLAPNVGPPNKAQKTALGLPAPEVSASARSSSAVTTAVERFIAALERIWAIKGFRFRSELAGRLSTLRSACLDEELPLSLDSVEQLISFLQHHPHLAMPKIAITPEGHARASWTRDKDRHFAIQFVGGGFVRFVLFAPRERDNTARIAGTETEALILAHASQLGANWLA